MAGHELAVDGTLIAADASPQSRLPPERLCEVAQVSRTVQEYLAELEQQNPVTEPRTVSLRPSCRKNGFDHRSSGAWKNC